jgi:hypothetical protein
VHRLDATAFEAWDNPAGMRDNLQGFRAVIDSLY